MGEARCKPGDDWIFADKASDNRHGGGGMPHGSDRRPAHGDYRVGTHRGEGTREARQFLPWPGLDTEDEIVALGETESRQLGQDQPAQSLDRAGTRRQNAQMVDLMGDLGERTQAGQ